MILATPSLREHHHPDKFIKFSAQGEEGEDLSPEILAAIMMANIARSLGVPMWEDEEDLSPDLNLFEQLRLAGIRSMNAQDIRNRKK